MFLLIYTWLARHTPPSPMLSTIILLVEIVALNSLIAINGAASNPFSMVLLVPLVLGLMLLPLSWASAVIVFSLAGQITQLYLPQSSHSDASMMVHAQSMIVGFVMTTLLITAVVVHFRRQLGRQSQALQIARERQLRDEQLLAIGTAAAQLTHDAASPIQTARLLAEEARESNDITLVEDIDQQIQRLQHMLDNWRAVADDVRQANLVAFEPRALIRSLRHVVALARPESEIEWPTVPSSQISVVFADRTLLPALTSIILNACEASERARGGAVSFSVNIQPDYWRLVLINKVCTQDKIRLETLGQRLVPSQHGSGAGAALSNATLEKFGGEVRWSHHQNSAMTEIRLPAQPATETLR